MVNLKNDNVGFMKIVLQKGIVSNFERSTLLPDTRSAKKTNYEFAGRGSTG
ncbi:hypothetical protein LJK87_37635 [Paenibacillus sp. P25]|nr:hypothetical protein LJK87_37635 [Paenibacillus sp. P25]